MRITPARSHSLRFDRLQPATTSEAPPPPPVDTFEAADASPVAQAQAADAPDRFEDMVANTYRTVLGREPDAAGQAGWVAQADAWSALGASDDDISANLAKQFQQSDEFVGGLVNDQYQAVLGRDADPLGLDGYSQMVREQLSNGASPDDVKTQLAGILTSSEEYRGLHPDAPVDAPADAPATDPAATTGRNDDRNAIYLQQPNGWSCGPTSLAMAMAAFGLRPANQNTVSEMINALHASSAEGTPGGPSYFASVAQGLGLDAHSSTSQNPSDMRAELEAGRGVIVNGSLGNVGHFIYLAGIADDGRFIVCDPYRPGVTRMTDAELQQFARAGSHPPGYTSVARA
jgi:hypothetical protein